MRDRRSNNVHEIRFKLVEHFGSIAEDLRNGPTGGSLGRPSSIEIAEANQLYAVQSRPCVIVKLAEIPCTNRCHAQFIHILLFRIACMTAVVTSLVPAVPPNSNVFNFPSANAVSTASRMRAPALIVLALSCRAPSHSSIIAPDKNMAVGFALP